MTIRCAVAGAARGRCEPGGATAAAWPASRSAASKERIATRGTVARWRGGALFGMAIRQCSPGSAARLDRRRPRDARRNNRPMLTRRRLLAALAAPPAGRGAGPAPKPRRARRAAAPRRRPRAGRIGPGAQPAAGLRRRHRHRRPARSRAGAGRARGGPRRRGRRRARSTRRRPRQALEQQGLVHDRRPIAAGEFILVGPAPREAGARPAAAARQERRRGARARSATRPRPTRPASSSCPPATARAPTSPSRRSGARRRIAPAAPWYVAADAEQPASSPRCAPRGAYALVERGAWAALGGAPLAVIVEGDPQLVESVHAMRSFRVSHPAGKIFIAWIAGGRGRAVGRRARAATAAALRPRAMARSGRLLSLNVARASAVAINGRTVHDGDRQARRSRAPRAVEPLGIEGDEQADLVGARRPEQGGLRLPERALPVLADGAGAGRRRAVGRAAAAGRAGREPDRRRRRRERASGSATCCAFRTARSPSASRAIPASSSTPRWASRTPPS